MYVTEVKHVKSSPKLHECCKLAQKKRKTKHDWARKVIHSKRLNFGQANKYQNLFKKNNILRDKNGLLNPSPDLVLIKKKKRTFGGPADQKVKIKESEKNR